MTLYTRHQLALLVLLVAATGAGLAVHHWRRAHPELAARLEALDRAAQTAAPRPQSPAAAGPARRPADGPLDLNRAGADELSGLPGIGPALAARIVAARTTAPFATVDDVRRVRGVGRATLERLRSHVSVRP